MAEGGLTDRLGENQDLEQDEYEDDFEEENELQSLQNQLPKQDDLKTAYKAFVKILEPPQRELPRLETLKVCNGSLDNYWRRQLAKKKASMPKKGTIFTNY